MRHVSTTPSISDNHIRLQIMIEIHREKTVTFAPFSKFHCIKCGFIGRPKLSQTGKAMTVIWLSLLLGGIFAWPLLLVWAGTTVAAVFVFEKLCCCPSCGDEDAEPERK